MSVVFLIMHCPAFPGRSETAKAVGDALMRDLGPYDDGPQTEASLPSVWAVRIDPGKSGAWRTARDCWQAGLESGRDFIVVLNDDVLLPPGFCAAAEAALVAARARSPESPVCFYTANARAEEAYRAGAAFYSTPDGLVGVACGMHRDNVKAFLEWHDLHFEGEHTDDGRVNLWAMATQRRVLTTLPSLVDHQLPDESTVGNTHHDYRRPAVPPERLERAAEHFQRGPIARFGRQYRGNHWRLLTNTKPSSWRELDAVNRAYALERDR